MNSSLPATGRPGRGCRSGPGAWITWMHSRTAGSLLQRQRTWDRQVRSNLTTVSVLMDAITLQHTMISRLHCSLNDCSHEASCVLYMICRRARVTLPSRHHVCRQRRGRHCAGHAAPGARVAEERRRGELQHLERPVTHVITVSNPMESHVCRQANTVLDMLRASGARAARVRRAGRICNSNQRCQ